MERPRRPPVYRNRINPLNYFDEHAFIARYRLPKHIVRELSQRFARSPYISTAGDARGRGLHPEERFCAAIRYLATGANYSTISDYQGISKSTLSRAVNEVIRFLWSLTYEFIIWPYYPDQLGNKAREFFEATGKPCTIGCVDGTHIPIKRPSRDEEGEYINRKLYHSINAMVITDANNKFICIEDRFPGNVHDAFVINASRIQTFADEGRFYGYWLLGDSGYPLRPWLMVPVHDPQTPEERAYNRWHIRTRSSVERSIGLLKQRWRCLDHSAGYLMHKPSTCAYILRSCAILHNIAVDQRVPLRIDNDPDGNIPQARRDYGAHIAERNPEDYDGQGMNFQHHDDDLIGGEEARRQFIDGSFAPNLVA